MYEYLRQHPQIFMPFHKEPLFFGEDLTRRYGRMTLDEYESLFAAARPGQRIGEASAWYLYSRSAAQEICAFAPRAQIVVMLRNPVDVMYAQHSQLLFNQQEEIASFEEALSAEDDRREGRRLPPGPIRPENLFYRDMVRFADQLERYFDVFGRESVHVIIHDDLRADLPGVYRDLLDFLHVSGDFRPSFEKQNENKRVRNQWLQRLIFQPPGWRWLVPRLRRYPLIHRLRGRLLTLNSEKRRRAPLDPALRARLVEDLAPEIRRLGELLDRDLTAWSSMAAPGG